MDTSEPQMETPYVYRVLLLRSGVFESVRYISAQETDAVERWAYSQLSDLKQDGDGQIWAAVIETGHLTGDPYHPTASPLFLPTANKRRGVLLDPTVLKDPLVSMDEIFALRGCVF